MILSFFYRLKFGMYICSLKNEAFGSWKDNLRRMFDYQAWCSHPLVHSSWVQATSCSGQSREAAWGEVQTLLETSDRSPHSHGPAPKKHREGHNQRKVTSFQVISEKWGSWKTIPHSAEDYSLVARWLLKMQLLWGSVVLQQLRVSRSWGKASSHQMHFQTLH